MSLETFDPQTALKTIPHKPGVYRMLNEKQQVLYVGKAKDLKNRVSSYFRGNLVNSRIYAMVKQIRDIQITLTNTEAEALLLESNLIKKHQPRYNVLLRDGKAYPWLQITADDYPRLRVYRGSRKQKGRYYGPYPSAAAVHETLNLLQKIFRIRQCEDSYFANRSRPCLQYQIKRCSAPCVELISQQDYAESISHVEKFLKGQSQHVIDDFVVKMEQAAQRLDFEKAADYRDQIEYLRHVSQQQYISGGNSNVDVIALHRVPDMASVLVFSIRQGHNLGNRNFYPRLPDVDMSAGEILETFMAQYYMNHEIPHEILLSHLPADAETLREMLSQQAAHNVSFSTQLRGERARWLALAVKNAQHALDVQLASKAGMQKRLNALREALQLGFMPTRMECFDISHTLGEATVASCVVFGVDGPLKSDYRRFNISNITPGDDYAAMHQALTRRYAKLVKTEAKLPDILFIDGGKGQVKQAREVLKDLAIETVHIVGVAKGEGRKPGLESLILDGNQVLRLDAHSSALHLIQHIRDESHRFAITAHRQRRAKARKTSPLEDISGLGPKRRQLLLKQFGGLRGITRASVDELAKVSGISCTLAEKVYHYFHDDVG